MGLVAASVIDSFSGLDRLGYIWTVEHNR